MSSIYEPTANWISKSHIAQFIKKTGRANYRALQERAAKETEWFWKEALADIGLDFHQDYTKLLALGLPWPKWAVGGKISIVENCIDRHLKNQADKTALIFEADLPGQSHQWSFQDLARESSYICRLLQEAGAQKGDRAALLMPMSLEMIASFFGILRAGMSVIPIFSGYGAEAIQSRLQDAKIKYVFVQDKTTRRGKEIPVKENLLKLLPQCPDVKKVFALNREEFLKGHSQEIIPSVVVESEAESLLLYTSGTTGKPKACVHTAFGVLATTGKEHRYAFDVHSNDRFFWYTDIGWMMGPWELFGALQFGATVMVYEGVPDFPNTDRLWEILSDHQITHLGISPTAIRVLKKTESAYLKKANFESLRILGSTGEPWDEDSWLWYFENVGKKRCPIINISGGTEIMGCLLSPTPLDALKPTTLAGPALGVNAQIWDENAKALDTGIGHLVCLSPLPSMTKGFLNSPQRYLDTYFSKFGDHVWYHGDWAYRDEDGFWFLKGRSDDTIKVAGKRVGPNEFESALMEDPRVAESAAVGIPHEIKGESVCCFVVLKNEKDLNEETRKELKAHLTHQMGKALAPEKILFCQSLPKTRSGKILRSIVQKISLRQPYDSSAIENPQSIEAIQAAK